MFLITGSNGQLGTELAHLLPDAVLTDINDLDITNEQQVMEFVKNHDIDTIINCAAYTAVDKAENDEATAKLINAKGPENLAKTGCKLVHISTDYVFDGTGHKPYTPEDEPNPVSAYGRTKLAGEKAVLANAKEAVIIRTAWLYSPYGNNFVKTIRRVGAERGASNVVCDQIGSPTYAADLAKAIVDILPQISEKNKGVYHFSNEGACSWFDFAKEIIDISKIDCKVSPVLSAEYPTAAKRPYYSLLDKNKIKQTFGVSVPYWKDSLKDCIAKL